MNRRERELQARRADILLAAGRVLANKGFDAMRMAEVAREAEVSVGAIYQLFQSKDALEVALLEEKAGRLLTHAEIKARALPGQPGGVQKLAGVQLLLSDECPEDWLGRTLSRREREAQSKRRDILDAAARIFVEKGFHGTAMADIAEEAGVATGTLYSFFPSKEDLYFTLFEEKADEFLLYLQAEVSRVQSAVEKVTRLIEAEYAFFEANGTLFWICISPGGGSQWAAREDLGERFRAKHVVYLDWVAGIIEAGIQEGSLRSMDAKELAQALVGMLNASILERAADGQGQSSAARAQRMVDLFLRGAQRP